MTNGGFPAESLSDAVASLPGEQLTTARQAALTRFLERGFPTMREEDWKYTDLGPVAAISSRWLQAGATPGDAALARELGDQFVASIDACWVVIANGSVPGLSEVSPPPGVELSPLSGTKSVSNPDAALADLNLALLRDGIHIRVGKDTAVDVPLGLVFVDVSEDSPGVSQTRVRVELEQGASASIIEYHLSKGDGEHYANSVMDITLGDDTVLNVVRVQDRATNHNQTSHTLVRNGARSVFRYGGFDLGGRLIRNDLDIDITSEASEVEVAGLYIAGQDQHIDNHVRIDHRTGPARSRQEYRGILAGRCRGVWNGKAIVHEGADGTDAEQSNHNLLLSDRAEIDAKPELEIYADEVKCSHGTTVGQLDDDALFYLRSRGLDEQEATRALTRAFGAGIVSQLPVAEMAETLTAKVETRLGELTGRESS
jgi:Fe-S cluster assembly protein SufD